MSQQKGTQDIIFLMEKFVKLASVGYSGKELAS